MKLPGWLKPLIILIFAFTYIMPINIFADDIDIDHDTGDTEIEAYDKYIENANYPELIIDEYGNRYYEGDYNDYDHEEKEESRWFLIMLPGEFSGHEFIASGGETSVSGYFDEKGEALFSLPYVNEYNITIDSYEVEIPDGIAITNIPGATLEEEGDITISIDLSPNWSGAVFSAGTTLYSYIGAYSVDENGILTIHTADDGDIEISTSTYDELDQEASYSEEGITEEEFERQRAEESAEENSEIYSDNRNTDSSNTSDPDTDQSITEKEAEEISEEEEESGLSVMVIIAIIVVAVLIVIAIIYYILRNRVQRQYKMDESIYYEDDDDEDEYRDNGDKNSK